LKINSFVCLIFKARNVKAVGKSDSLSCEKAFVANQNIVFLCMEKKYMAPSISKHIPILAFFLAHFLWKKFRFLIKEIKETQFCRRNSLPTG
jgi:hypothetical protein